MSSSRKHIYVASLQFVRCHSLFWHPHPESIAWGPILSRTLVHAPVWKTAICVHWHRWNYSEIIIWAWDTTNLGQLSFQDKNSQEKNFRANKNNRKTHCVLNYPLKKKKKKLSKWTCDWRMLDITNRKTPVAKTSWTKGTNNTKSETSTIITDASFSDNYTL